MQSFNVQDQLWILIEYFYLSNVFNITISGGKIIGDRDSHIGTTGEAGMLINIENSTDVTISNMDLSKAWGDGIYITGSNDGVLTTGITTDIIIHNIRSHHNRRQGITIAAGQNINISNCFLHDISGTDPSAGIDIEPPKNSNLIAENINITNCISYNNKYGFCASGRFVNFTNCISFNTTSRGFWIALIEGSGSKAMQLNNCVVRNNGTGIGDEIGVFISAVEDCSVVNCILENPGAVGISIKNTLQNTRIIGNKLYGTTIAGIGTDAASHDIIISENIIHNCYRGIDLYASEVVCSDNMVSDGNSFGITLRAGATNVITSNNQIKLNGSRGIAVFADDCIINDNECYSNGSSSYDNIYVSGNNNMIRDNKVRKGTRSARAGLYIETGATTNKVIFNDLTDGGTVDIMDNGTGTIINNY